MKVVRGSDADASAQLRDPFGLRAGSGILRAGNVGLRKHHVRAHLQNERLFRAVRVKQPIEFIGLDELCRGNGECARRLRRCPLARGASMDATQDKTSVAAASTAVRHMKPDNIKDSLHPV